MKNKKCNCEICEHCIYIGEGGYMCEMNNDIVIDDFEPTADFYSCKGKNYERSE